MISNLEKILKKSVETLFFELWYIIKNTDFFAYFFISLRGGGKTYSILKGLLIEDKCNFVYMRRTEVELKYSMSKKHNPFSAINRDFNTDYQIIKDKEYYYVVKNVERNDKEKITNYEYVASCFALSQVQNIKGSIFSNLDYILFDEFLAEKTKGDSLFSEEGRYFASILETINRNNYLENRKETRLIFLGNATTLKSGILTELKIAQDVFEVVQKQRKALESYKCYKYIEDKDVLIFLPRNKKFSEKKKQSRTYKFLKDSSYVDFSLNGEFLNENLDNVKVLDNKQLTPLYSIDKYYFYKDKITNYLYISYRKHDLKHSDMKEFKNFNNQHGFYICTMDSKDKIIYSDYDLKNSIAILFKL